MLNFKAKLNTEVNNQKINEFRLDFFNKKSSPTENNLNLLNDNIDELESISLKDDAHKILKKIKIILVFILIVLILILFSLVS